MYHNRTTSQSSQSSAAESSLELLDVVLGCCTLPVVAGLLVHQQVQQWLGTTAADSSQVVWQDRRLPTLDRPPSQSDIGGEQSDAAANLDADRQRSQEPESD
ncbi:MAG: hypothetical protein AAFX40_13750 [Cyanobacteria bacterium J06639_1]